MVKVKVISLPPKLDWNLILPWLGEARSALGRLDEISEPLPLSLFETNFWEESIHSLHPQKIRTTLREVLSFHAGKPIAEKQAAVLKKVVLVKEALHSAIRSRNVFDRKLWNRIHKMVKKDGINPKDIGKIRKRQNWIGPEGGPIEEAYFLPPPPNKILRQIHQLESYLKKEETDPLIQIALSFAQFLIIHPYMDGNGRVARILIPIWATQKKLLSRPLLLMSKYFDQTRLEYVDQLFNISKKQRWEDWVIYFLKGVIDSAHEMKERGKELKQLFAKIPEESLFLHPVIAEKNAPTKWIQKKTLIEGPKGFYTFRQLIQ